MSKPPQETRLDWTALLETALNTPGSTGDAYNRFHDYSFLNRINLLMQGCPMEPIATYRKWCELGRQVQKGAKAFEIVRPIVIPKKDEAGDKTGEAYLRFKPVRCIFPVSMTEGEPLPPVKLRLWDEHEALQNLDIKRVPFQSFDSNVAGYSYGRNVAVSVVAPFPQKTLFHEAAHVIAGHTAPGQHAEYLAHRGVFEFEAEASAHLAMNELELDTPDSAYLSRGYIQSWMEDRRPPERSIRTVFKTTELILKAGRLAMSGMEDAA